MEDLKDSSKVNKRAVNAARKHTRTKNIFKIHMENFNFLFFSWPRSLPSPPLAPVPFPKMCTNFKGAGARSGDGGERAKQLSPRSPRVCWLERGEWLGQQERGECGEDGQGLILSFEESVQNKNCPIFDAD